MQFFLNLFVTKRIFIALFSIVVLFVFAHFFPVISIVPRIALLVMLALVLVDFILLYSTKKPLVIHRYLTDRLSNGDENKVTITILNNRTIVLSLRIIEELPIQLQKRDFLITSSIHPGQSKNFLYSVIPSTRGAYHFGNTLVFISSLLGLIERRIKGNNAQSIAVYPGFKKMQQYTLMATTNRLSEMGVKQVRKLGNSTEFDHIKDYVKGDDIRTINWKASARRNNLMVNKYTDERRQNVYCLINKGRVMKMPFDGLSLLDYAINASLVLSNVALSKKDKAGLVTFSNKMDTFIPADGKSTQLNRILHHLYKEETNFLETDFEKLYNVIHRKIPHRSLLVLFTNFEAFTSLERELPFLAKIAKSHLLLVVFFENTEVSKLLNRDSNKLDEVYAKIIAEKLSYEKRKIVRELNNNGIVALLSPPDKLSINTLNKYLELKNRHAI
jgi:uncharacterized protein (DUF58 family)